MDLDQIMNKRFSVRKFKSDKISDEMIEQIINAARLAPTGNNAQPQKFYVITSDENKNKLKEVNAFKQPFVYDAPVIIVCTGNPNAYPSVEGSNETRAIRDISISSTHLVLKSTELGLGSCFVGWIERDAIKKALNIPKEYVIPYVIPIGYVDMKQHELNRKPLGDYYLKL